MLTTCPVEGHTLLLAGNDTILCDFFKRNILSLHYGIGRGYVFDSQYFPLGNFSNWIKPGTRCTQSCENDKDS